MNFKELLEAHSRAHKITPGQQVNLLTYYLGLHMMFPEITFDRYLDRTLAVAGATDANLQFPKDALDAHCPNKGSAWTPDERIDMILTYLALDEILAADNPPIQMPFADFLAEEAPRYKAEQAQSPPVAAAMPPPGPAPGPPPSAPAPPKRTTRKTDAGTGVAVASITVGSRLMLRVPNGPVSAGSIIMSSATGWTFRTDAGEDIPVTDATWFEPMQAVIPPPAAPAGGLHQQLVISAADAAEIQAWLQSPGPLTHVGIGDVLKSYHVPFSNTTPGDAVMLEVINAQPKPCIDAYFSRNGRSMGDTPPRESSLFGVYDFTVGDVVYRLEVVAGA